MKKQRHPTAPVSKQFPPSDVVVIGGGVAGLANAWQLAKEGLKVTVLERGLCGQEASWAGAGVLQCGNWHRRDPLVGLLRESLRRYDAFTAELRERTGIDPEFIHCGSFELLFEDQQYRMAASEVRVAEEYRETYGRAVLELLPPEEARRIEPGINPEILGVKANSVSCQVRNPLLMAALKSACSLENVQIVENCSVREILRDDDKVTGVRADPGTFSTPNVVLSAGPWSSLIDKEVGRLVQVYPVRGQIVLLETPRRLFTHIVERGKCYMVPRLDGRIVIGATEEHEAGYDKRNTTEGICHLTTLCQKLVPALSGATVVRTWAGLRPGTPDRGPYIGAVPGWSGLWSASGHFRSGLILAPITGQIMADLIVRGATAWDIGRLSPGREITQGKPMVEDPSGA